MRRLALVSLLVLSTGAVVAQDATRAGGVWQVPPCDVITGTKSLAITSDEGATLVPTAHRLLPTSYAFGLAVLPDVPNTMYLAFGRTLQRSTTAGCRWDTVGTVDSTSDGFPISLVAARGDRAFVWSENRNDLARVDGTTITYLGAPVDSIVGMGTDPGDADHVRFGAGDGTLWDAIDGGVRFGQIGSPVPGLGFVYRTAFDPKALDHVVVGAIVDGAYVTFDGARTWTKATGLSSTGDGPVNVFSVVVSPADSMTVYAMGLDIDEADAGDPSQGRHIYLSRDGGMSFRPVADNSVDIVLTNGVPMAAHPTDANVVYFTYGSSFAGYGTDVYRYDDATGQTTKTHNSFQGMPSIAFNPADPSYLYLGVALEAID